MSFPYTALTKFEARLLHLETALDDLETNVNRVFVRLHNLEGAVFDEDEDTEDAEYP